MTTDPQLSLLLRDPWAGQPATRGSLPRVPQRESLPSASAELAGCLVRIPGATGVADATYECVKGGDDTYSWVQIDGPDDGPAGYVGKDQLTTGKTGISTATVVVDNGVDATAVGERRYKITCTIYTVVSSGGSSSLPSVQFRKDGTILHSYQLVLPDTNSQVHTFWLTDTVTDATALYDIAVAVGIGDNVNVNACYILVEDIGAAP